MQVPTPRAGTTKARLPRFLRLPVDLLRPPAGGIIAVVDYGNGDEIQAQDVLNEGTQATHLAKGT